MDNLFDRPDQGERALLVQVNWATRDERVLFEFTALAQAAGVEIIDLMEASRDKPDVKTYVGSGKVLELAQCREQNDIDLVIFNHFLSPSQERELEAALKCRVLGRAGLILDIFAQRARSFEGKLQVELAQLQHMATRLVRGWTHLERQKGGVGLRGPGETQLETDRRLLRLRVKQLRARLATVKKRRLLSRSARQRAEIKTASLVGYTNTGKSTLFNRLTSAEVLAKDMLFATLDPTCRRVELSAGRQVVLVDTVGFVRDLPHELIEAFHATLQETEEADLLIHVIDQSDPQWREREADVIKVLDALGLEDKPMMRVFNKIDAQPGLPAAGIQARDDGGFDIWLSAQTGEGMAALPEILCQALGPAPLSGEVVLGPHEGRLRAQLYAEQSVHAERVDELGNCCLDLRIDAVLWARLTSGANFPDRKRPERDAWET